jgi:hypothetical protein
VDSKALFVVVEEMRSACIPPKGNMDDSFIIQYYKHVQIIMLQILRFRVMMSYDEYKISQMMYFIRFT